MYVCDGGHTGRRTSTPWIWPPRIISPIPVRMDRGWRTERPTTIFTHSHLGRTSLQAISMCKQRCLHGCGELMPLMPQLHRLTKQCSFDNVDGNYSLLFCPVQLARSPAKSHGKPQPKSLSAILHPVCRQDGYTRTP